MSVDTAAVVDRVRSQPEHVPAPIVAGLSVDEQKVLRYLGLSPDDVRAQAVLAICQRYDLDPLLKHMQLIAGKGGAQPYITRDGYLHIAHASGVFDGMSAADLRLEGNEWIATVTAWRRDMSHGFTYVGRAARNNESGGADPRDMAVTRAERRALKRAFDVAGGLEEDEHSDTPSRVAVVEAVPADTATEAPTDAEAPQAAGADPRSQPAPAAVEPIDKTRSDRLHKLLRDVGHGSRGPGLELVSGVLGRPVASTKELSADEADQVIDALADVAAEAAVIAHDPDGRPFVLWHEKADEPTTDEEEPT